MPNEEDVDEAKASTATGLRYVKLHGSQNWRGRRGFVIGREKREQVKEESLLEWYMEQFCAAVEKRDAQMLCIGYGFGDEYINDILVAGIEAGMRLHVVDPEDPGEWHHRLPDTHRQGIWRGLASYHQCAMRDLFPWHNQPTTAGDSHELARLKRSILQ